MRLVLLGPPGSGKGTQSVRLKEKLGISHVSSGELLRDAVKRRTTLGKKAQEFIRAQEKWEHPYYWAAWVLWGLAD